MSNQPSETVRLGPPSGRVPILPLTKESKERLHELLRDLELGDVDDHEFTDEVMGLMSQMSADELERVLHLLIDSS